MTARELRSLTDEERARWVQSLMPRKFVDCPACNAAGCPACVHTGRMSRSSARAWVVDLARAEADALDQHADALRDRATQLRDRAAEIAREGLAS